MKNLHLLLAVITALIVSACGGGGDTTPPPSTLGGVAAVGSPIAGGAISVKCKSGTTLTATTSSSGAWQVTFSGHTLPCAVAVSGGTINSTANNTSYYSIATSTGTVNVTPLTTLVVANLAEQDPATWFIGASSTTLTPITTTQVSTALTNVLTPLGLASLGTTINPLTTAFTATPGNPSDDLLTALNNAMATTGVNYTTLLAAATTTTNLTATAAPLNTTLSASYPAVAPTVTGFNPISGVTGTPVTITGSNFSTTAANNTVRFNGTAATVTAATATSLTVLVPAGAATGAISVSTTGGTATSAGNFTVTTTGGGGGGGSGTASQFFNAFSNRGIGSSWSYSATSSITSTYPGATSYSATASTVATLTASANGVVTATFTYTNITPIPQAPITDTSTWKINTAGAFETTGSTSTEIVLPATFTVGTTWVSLPATATNGASNNKVTAFNVTRTVPAGTFTDCLEIQSTSTFYDPLNGSTTVSNSTLYISPTAGFLIEASGTDVSTSAAGTATVNYSQQLQSYVVN